MTLVVPPATRCPEHQAAADTAARARRARSAANRPRRVYADAEYRRNAKVVAERARANREVCVKCGRPFAPGETITAEHLIAVRNGGSNALSNLGPAHSRCNTGWNRKAT